jgi:hypothetical protein
VEPEAVSKVGRDVEFAAADMDMTLGSLAEGNNSRIEAMNQCAKRKKI